MLTFLNGLDSDLRSALLTQLRNLWTHTSTSIEGNTLTLGETAFVLKEGLTISGKPLKDHEEVVGHARAIDLLYEIIQKENFSEKDMFSLHKAVQTEIFVDIYRPVGGWKKESNSTVAVIDGKQIIFEYAAPSDVPILMKRWFALYRKLDKAIKAKTYRQALEAYVQLHVAFVLIHPFFDGNGRMARLIANIPVLKSGFPPIIIPREQRKEYIDLLSAYHFSVGQIKGNDELLPKQEKLEPITAFCERAWQESVSLVEEAKSRQQKRRK